MKQNYTVKEITKEQALEMVKKYHYSNTLPRLNKHFVGFFIDGELVGVVTLGWGTRPLDTIRCLFPSLSTKDYYEIGRMCMTEDMPNGSESQMLKALHKWIKQNCPDVKVLFTWADGMRGKPGYVYQASGFTYAGFVWTDAYFVNGMKIHPRQCKKFITNLENDKRKFIRPTVEQMKKYGIEQYFGKQFRYIRFLCGKNEKNRLLKECKVDLTLPNPKDKDLEWKRRDLNTRKHVPSDMPLYTSEFNEESLQ